MSQTTTREDVLAAIEPLVGGWDQPHSLFAEQIRKLREIASRLPSATCRVEHEATEAMCKAMNIARAAGANAKWQYREAERARLASAPAAPAAAAETEGAVGEFDEQSTREALNLHEFWQAVDAEAEVSVTEAETICERLARSLHARGLTLNEIVAVATGGNDGR